MPLAVSRGVAMLVLTLVLSACASVPLSTLWKMRGFGSDDLQRLAPEQLRVAGRLEPAPVRIDPQSVVLALTLIPSEGGKPVRHEFGLKESRVFDASLSPVGGPQWQVFELDGAGLASMRKMQPQFARMQKDYEKFEFSVNWRSIGQPLGNADELIVSIRLQLAANQSPLTLFDRARIPLKRAESP